MLSTGRNTTDIKAIEIVSQVLLSLGNPSLSSKAEIYSIFIFWNLYAWTFSMMLTAVLHTRICQGQRKKFTHDWWGGPAGATCKGQDHPCKVHLQLRVPDNGSSRPQWTGPTVAEREHEKQQLFQAPLLYCPPKRSLTNSNHWKTLRDLLLTQNHLFRIFAMIWGSEPLLIFPRPKILGNVKPVVGELPQISFNSR